MLRESFAILGGSWNEPVYMFQAALRMDPFDRSPANGFRCMKGRKGEPAEELKASVDLPASDFYKMEGLSDEVFQEYMKMFSYGKTPLNPALESADATGMIRGARASPSTLPTASVSRYISTCRRRPLRRIKRSSTSQGPTRSIARTSKWVQNIGRTLDYLESRDDIDAGHVAYMGLSLGPVVAPIVLASEPRFKSAVLITGGMWPTTSRMVSRITVPVLLLAGRYDYIFPVATHQVPFMDLLGTPDKDKRHVIFEAGHLPLPRSELIRNAGRSTAIKVRWCDSGHDSVVLVELGAGGYRATPFER